MDAYWLPMYTSNPRKVLEGTHATGLLVVYLILKMG